MLKIIKFPWLYTGTSMVVSSGSSPSSLASTSPSPIYHRTIYQLPLETWIELTVTEDLGHLLISGLPTELELQDAFDNMITEVASLMHTDKSEAMLRIMKRIHFLQWQIVFIENTLNWLREKHAFDQGTDEHLLTELRRLGYNYKFDPTDKYQYNRELSMVESRAKTLLRTRKDLLVEYNRMVNGNLKPGQQPKKKTREDYEHELGILWRFQGSKIDKARTMTSEYYVVLSQYNKAQKAAEKPAKHARA